MIYINNFKCKLIVKLHWKICPNYLMDSSTVFLNGSKKRTKVILVTWNAYYLDNFIEQMN